MPCGTRGGIAKTATKPPPLAERRGFYSLSPEEAKKLNKGVEPITLEKYFPSQEPIWFRVRHRLQQKNHTYTATLSTIPKP